MGSMELLGYIGLFVILCAAVVLLIVAARASKKDKEKAADSLSDEPSTKGEIISTLGKKKKDPPPESIPVKKADKPTATPPEQTTIYQFRSARRVRICPCCDGENDPANRFCAICRQRLS